MLDAVRLHGLCATWYKAWLQSLKHQYYARLPFFVFFLHNNIVFVFSIIIFRWTIGMAKRTPRIPPVARCLGQTWSLRAPELKHGQKTTGFPLRASTPGHVYHLGLFSEARTSWHPFVWNPQEKRARALLGDLAMFHSIPAETKVQSISITKRSETLRKNHARAVTGLRWNTPCRANRARHLKMNSSQRYQTCVYMELRRNTQNNSQ